MKFLQRLRKKQSSSRPLYFFNTLTKSKDEFTLRPWARTVRMYNCGPTVYGRQHIGNLSMFIFTDVLRRTLEFNGLSAKQIINFTDVGHLVSDSDLGEDKMTKGLKSEGLELTLENMKTLGKKYADMFLDDIRLLNIDTQKITFPFASDHIADDIAMIKTLEEKSYAYRTKKGLYFDTSRFPSYGKLGNIELSGLKTGARVAVDPKKRSPTDFNLWKLNRRLGWESPWGRGFPGWHIECSAMIHHYLGDTIDIHTGGIEHIPVHHNNEIAQTEAATGKPLARFWLHRAHLQIEGSKVAKSEGNVIYLSEITGKNIHPLAFRYLLLTTHYRSPFNFRWEALLAAQTSFLKLRRFVDSEEKTGTPPLSYQKKIHERFNDDLDTPGAVGILWEMMKDRKLSPINIKAGLLDADQVFGLGLGALDPKAQALSEKQFGKLITIDEVPERIQQRIRDREEARRSKNWEFADTIRNELQRMGYTLEDSAEGTRVFKK